jgi:hypothetical protein
VYIFSARALASCRWRPLSSNVRRHGTAICCRIWRTQLNTHLRTLYLAASCSAFAQAATAIPVQWLPSAGGNGHFYEVVSVPTGITWNDARVAAIAAGGYLATSTSAAENAFVFSLANNPIYWLSGTINTFGPWLGGFQPSGSPEPAGGWQWLNGEGAFVYTNWTPGSPNNGAGGAPESYLAFYAPRINATAPTWDDAGEATLLRSYVIESPVPEPSTAAMLIGGVLAVLAVRRRARTVRD